MGLNYNVIIGKLAELINLPILYEETLMVLHAAVDCCCKCTGDPWNRHR
jgi:hypothetical protein